MRDIHIVMDGRFTWFEGKAYSGHMYYDLYGKRYLVEGCEKVHIHARAFDSKDKQGLPVEADRVIFQRFAAYKGVKQFLLCFPKLLMQCYRIVFNGGLIILYLPGTLPFISYIFCRIFNKHFSVFVVADPEDQLSPEALRHPLQPYIRKLYVWLLKGACLNANSAMYVTQRYLQRKYPTLNSKNEFGASDVNLTEDFISGVHRTYTHIEQGGALALVYVASLNQAYKGHDLLLDALGKANALGILFNLTLIGGGSLCNELKTQAARLGIGERVSFLGHIADRRRLVEELDKADVFITPSRAEGLPRAVLEAMGRGLPIIGTNVGGMPELVDDEFLVPPESSDALLGLVQKIASSPHLLKSQSKKSLDRANDYLSSKTNLVHKAFLQFSLSSGD